MAATDYRFEIEPGQPPSDQRRRWWMGCLIGCLATLVVLLVVGVLVGVWITKNFRGWVASGASEAIKQGIDSSDLPAEEKDQIKVEVDRVAVAFRDGKLSNEQAVALMEKFLDSPILTALIASAAEKNYIDKSGLNEEERAEARVTLRRFLRGAIAEKIPAASIDAALAHVADKQPDGNWQFRDKVSDEELRAFLAEAKRAADEAEIPEQPEEFDPSDEVKRIIDEAMTAPPPAAVEP